MKKSSYILRIDDVCPTMRRGSFERIYNACENLNIKPIIGIIPDNKDAKLHIEKEWVDFWPQMQRLVQLDWIIAQHGYQHIYNKHKTEFAGLPYEEQKRRISVGYTILTEKLNSSPRWFMAPAHSFDTTTCRVLQELSFTYITDGIAPYPLKKRGLIWVPQQLWRPRNMLFGLWTICIHPNTMSDKEIDTLIEFMKVHTKQFHNISLEPQKSLATVPMKILWGMALFLKRI